MGKMTPGEMITKKVPLENVVKGGFLELINKENHVKVLVEI